jgi:hypothetical protein
MTAKEDALVDRSKLDKALDKGARTELPPNIPPGFMGEVAPDMRKPEVFRTSLNAGVIQEATWETRVLTIALLYLLVVTSPIALYLLWRRSSWPTWGKALWTGIMLAGYVAAAFYTHLL